MNRFILVSGLLFLSFSLCHAVDNYTVKVLERYPHDAKAYTQGLFFNNGVLYETTGQYGESSIRKVELATGRVIRKLDLSRKYFGEGSCIAGGKFYMLTWTNKVAFVYDPTAMKYEKTISYPRDGWGLAAIPEGENVCPGASMVASDGSSNLYFLDSELRTLKTLKVTFDGRPLRLLNELEWIDGKIWANVYTTDLIVIIDPSTGKICGKVDCASLIPQNKRTPDMDVLNGIAARKTSSGKTEIFLTGKNWPALFKIQLVPSE